MPILRVTATVENATVGSSNPAQVSFTFNNGRTNDENGAAVALYLASVGPQVFAANTTLERLNLRFAGAPGGFDIPFPNAQFAAMQAAIAGPNVFSGSMTSYGVAMGGGGLTPVGTSVCMTERTNTLGRAGIGRHFIPFVTSLAVGADGELIPANANNMEQSWLAVIDQLSQFPVVTTGALTGPRPIVLIEARPILSNLRTRRR